MRTMEESPIEAISVAGRSSGASGSRRASLILLAASWALAALLFADDALGDGEQQWLRYHKATGSYNPVTASTRQYLAPLDQAPEGVAVPEFVGTRVHFARWQTPMVAKGYLDLAYDAAPGNRMKQRLFFDTDCDGSLADETPIPSTYCDRNWTNFELVPIVFPTEDGPVTYHIEVQFYKNKNAKNQFYTQASGWYEGPVTIGGKKYRCALVDYNSNGAFNDSYAIFFHSDQIKIGNEMGLVSNWFGKYIEIDGSLYVPDPVCDGAYVTFTRAEGVPLGTVDVPKDISRLSLAGTEGHIRLDLATDQPAVPAGKWAVENWRLNRTDEKGGRWSLLGHNTPKGAEIEIREGTRTRLDIGEPAEARLEVTVKNGTYTFDQKLRGRMGESLRLELEGRRAPAPRLSITNADGTYCEQFPFKYG